MKETIIIGLLIFSIIRQYRNYYLTNKNQKKIMATQQELTVQVRTLTEKVQKVGTETRTLLTKIEELLAQIAAGGEVAPELQAAVDDLQIQVNVVDELVPDAPTEPTEPTL